jgi:hypothetical protein
VEFVRAGRAILFRESAHAKPHLWFILTDPGGNPPRVVAVMLRTAQRFTDDTVVLHPGDHPFVRHPSSIHYSTARWLTVDAIARAFHDGRCSLQQDMSADLLTRARKGLMRSPFTVNAIRQYCHLRFPT